MSQAPRDSPAEAILAGLLKAEGMGLSFRRQVPLDGYVLDFYCKARRLAVEVDGKGHDEPAQQLHDRRRDAALLAQNIRTIRLRAEQVRSHPEMALEVVRGALAARFYRQHRKSTKRIKSRKSMVTVGVSVEKQPESRFRLGRKERILLITAELRVKCICERFTQGLWKTSESCPLSQSEHLQISIGDSAARDAVEEANAHT